MTKAHSKYIIVGAGLSGLTTAYQLLQKGEDDFLILEGRARVGGRVLTQNNIDLGPAWFQPNHQNLAQLLDNLGIKKFNQYSKGKSVLVHNMGSPAHYFESDQTQPSAHRIVGGSFHLIEKLSALLKDKIQLNTTVTAFNETEEIIKVFTSATVFSADRVIVTLPPKLAAQLDYSPQLPEHLVAIMNNTHTWMSNAIKVGLSFKTPFWREKQFSGTVIGQVGPVVELYDHTNADGTAFSLMGFVNEGLRDVSASDRKESILAYLEKYLGADVRNYLNYTEKDWSKDIFTSSTSLKPVYLSPKYGNDVFESFYMNDKLLFSGTETSPYFGGYLEGAVISGVLSANKL